MSALPSKADITWTSRDVRYVPIGGHCEQRANKKPQHIGWALFASEVTQLGGDRCCLAPPVPRKQTQCAEAFRRVGVPPLASLD
jgi:hypothetical protein